MKNLLLALPLFLLACTPVVDDVQPIEVTPEREVTSGLQERLPDTCKLERFEGFVGQNFADIIVPEGTKVRIVLPGMIVSQVYEADRVNIHVDGNGVVTKVICG
ncbi:MAG: I78 family peptidase inhibitor [Litoreibacter sp.]|nr:I78 family peptidase inhibitor [Litoreibacter sp.]MCY4336208.1 I78 family peptidase inhibitor [Litoreibacter sp.]